MTAAKPGFGLSAYSAFKGETLIIKETASAHKLKLTNIIHLITI